MCEASGGPHNKRAALGTYSSSMVRRSTGRRSLLQHDVCKRKSEIPLLQLEQEKDASRVVKETAADVRPP